MAAAKLGASHRKSTMITSAPGGIRTFDLRLRRPRTPYAGVVSDDACTPLTTPEMQNPDAKLRAAVDALIVAGRHDMARALLDERKAPVVKLSAVRNRPGK